MKASRFTTSRICLHARVLGTSSAFTVGLLLGLYALNDQMRNKHALAADAIHVEQNVIGEAVGSQDQVSAAYGGFNRINFNTDGSFQVRQVITSPDRLASAAGSFRALFYRFFADGLGDCQRADQDTPHNEKRAQTDGSNGRRSRSHRHKSESLAE